MILFLLHYDADGWVLLWHDGQGWGHFHLWAIGHHRMIVKMRNCNSIQDGILVSATSQKIQFTVIRNAFPYHNGSSTKRNDFHNVSLCILCSTISSVHNMLYDSEWSINSRVLPHQWGERIIDCPILLLGALAHLFWWLKRPIERSLLTVQPKQDHSWCNTEIHWNLVWFALVDRCLIYCF